MSMPLHEAIYKIWEELDLPLPQVAYDIARADTLGGYHENPELRKWDVGSIWEVEGQVLYALVRTLHPACILEFGTRFGCSTAHMLKALDWNAYGDIVTVDNGANGPAAELEHPRLSQVTGEGVAFSKTWERPVDMVFEDGPHSPEFTYEVVTNIMPHLSPGGIVVVHDTEHFLVGKDVSESLRRAVGDFGHVLIAPGDCGLGYWRKPHG